MAAKKFRKSKFSCPVGGFVGERCLKHRASSMNDAHVRKSHAIDRFHAWVDRSRSHGFMRPCLDFHYRMGLRVDVKSSPNKGRERYGHELTEHVATDVCYMNAMNFFRKKMKFAGGMG